MRPVETPGSAVQSESTGLRLTFLALVIASLFVLLFARLWFLQVMAGDRFVARAEGQAVRTIAIEAPRGDILDRNGQPIVESRYAQVVSVRPEEIPEARRDAVLADLAGLLGTTPADLQERIDDSRAGPLSARPVAFDVPEEIVFYLHENGATRFPGVYAERIPLRDYPYGALAAHVVGYTGEISAEQLAEPRYSTAGYEQGDVIGWSGVERTYEDVLRGQEGLQRVRVNARGEVLGDVEEVPPRPGADVRLTLDLRVQQLTEEALEDGIAAAQGRQDSESGAGRGGTFQAPGAAAVVLDLDTGEVVAMASYPTFEPERFVGGVGQTYWDFLQDEANHYPLINRVVSSAYPPGSVFKIVSSAAAMEFGYATRDDYLPCPGEFEYGQRVFRNWSPVDQGPYNLAESLQRSCDTVYYLLATRMFGDEQRQREAGQEPFEAIGEMARRFGFGQPTGIDLPSDRAGVVPGRRWRQEYWLNARDTYCTNAQAAQPGTYAAELFGELCEDGGEWRGGDLVNMSIGQGDVQTSPLQVANSFAGVANRGRIMRPHVVGAVVRGEEEDPVTPEVLHEVEVAREHLDFIEQGLVMVTQPGGTAAAAFEGFPYTIAGKTGTAENKPKQPYAWFAGYNVDAVGGQRYVVVAMVEEGGGGSQTAAPIVRRVFEGLFSLEQTQIVVGEFAD